MIVKTAPLCGELFYYEKLYVKKYYLVWYQIKKSPKILQNLIKYII